MTETVKLTASDGAANDDFGASVAIEGDTVVSGAFGDRIGTNSLQGSAYVYVVCDDGDPCTTDMIDSGTGACQHVAYTGACDHGNPCTSNDTCATRACAGEGPPVCVCDDENPCTDDTFDSGLGRCVFAPNTLACDDGNACTRIDTCRGGTCNGADPVVCFAADQCHDVDVCNPLTGFCSDPPSPDGAMCSDGSACTQVDTCQAGSCTGSDYFWSGVLQPINGDGSSIFKLGSTIPVKFRLTGACVGLLGFEARLYVAKLTDSVVGTEVEAISTSSADTGNLFRPAGDDQYVFNLSTDGLSKGTWILRIDLGDGVPNRTVTVSLK